MGRFFCRTPPGYTPNVAKADLLTMHLLCILEKIPELIVRQRWLTIIGAPKTEAAAEVIRDVQATLLMLGALQPTDRFRPEFLPTLAFALGEGGRTFSADDKRLAHLYKYA